MNQKQKAKQLRQAISWISDKFHGTPILVRQELKIKIIFPENFTKKIICEQNPSEKFCSHKLYCKIYCKNTFMEYWLIQQLAEKKFVLVQLLEERGEKKKETILREKKKIKVEKVKF